jgi:N-acetyl-gamma-glutamyl-phosphate/LysW-gamma-L-alpha-aminoadipyl-6-phosphate reductase
MIKVSIVGGSGYAGGELLRILLNHPQITIKQVTSRQFSGELISSVHPNLRKVTNLTFEHPDNLSHCDLLFVALPNGVSMGKMRHFMEVADKIIDLGSDFRIHDKDIFREWYKKNHEDPELLNKFVYGITELHREEIKRAKYVSCAGCEATVSILALYPLFKNNIIGSEVMINAIMSSSQSGMSVSLSSHHPERSGVVRSYMPTGHRHTAEIMQELAGIKPLISATSIDMVRGLHVTINTTPKVPITEKDIWKIYRKEYKDEPFIRIVKERSGLYRYPEPKILQGTNYCDIGFELDTSTLDASTPGASTNRLVVIAAIDNLVKGTAGQAVQDMNVMFGFEEREGLEFTGLHPI